MEKVAQGKAILFVRKYELGTGDYNATAKSP